VGANAGQGAAYVYSPNGSGWVQQAKLTASDGAPNNSFGYSVAIAGNGVVVVGAPDSFLGAAYVYSPNGSSWVQQAKLTASDGFPSSFGISVAIAGNTAVVGAPVWAQPLLCPCRGPSRWPGSWASPGSR
jgi:hypothetical protein